MSGRLRIPPRAMASSHRQGSTPPGQDPRHTTLVVRGLGLAGLGSREPGGRVRAPASRAHWNEDYPELPADQGRGGQDDADDPVVKLVIRRSRCRGRYDLGLKLVPRDSAVRRAIHEHWLCATVTYLDRETRKRWDARMSELIAEGESHWQRMTLFAPIPDPLDLAWVAVKTWWHRNHVERGLEITVNKLLGDDYCCWSDDFDDIRDIERSVLFSLDAIAQAIAVGMAFSEGEENVYHPGNRRKSHLDVDDGGTPPSAW